MTARSSNEEAARNAESYSKANGHEVTWWSIQTSQKRLLHITSHYSLNA